ncbi:MAG: beta-ketoacyl-[acyl-carrier-protein] synthase family protein, partial [Proteobacteria bacterium]|nr:beta-ketoacyl-[acyl-carrier-protein] synthase family protein [Pseudomonadota bacterium]
QFFLGATNMALDMAELPMETINPDRIGLYMGTLLCQPVFEKDIKAICVSADPNQPSKVNEPGYVNYLIDMVNPYEVLKRITNLVACNIAIEHQFKGPVSTYIDNCISGMQAIGAGVRTIQQGDADVMLCGGSETALSAKTLLDHYLIHPFLNSSGEDLQGCRPFDARRKGTVPGEGAGALVLESLDHARKRDAPILAEIKGYATTAGNPVFRNGKNSSSILHTMKKACDEAAISPEDIDYICANGDSTVLGDKEETAALKTLMGSQAYNTPISSIKAHTGHMMSASGPVEVIACLSALKFNILPPTLNYEEPDSECDLDYIPGGAREKEVSCVLSNCIGWFGQSASLVLQEF